MPLRLLGSFSVALIVGIAALALAGTWVSALERDLIGGGDADAAGRAFETGGALGTASRGGGPARVDCDALRREIHALSHEVSRCALVPECHGQPLRCPLTRDPRIEREYASLRDALHAHCGLPRSLVDFAWSAGEQVDLDADCAIVHDGWEAVFRGEAQPTSYSF